MRGLKIGYLPYLPAGTFKHGKSGGADNSGVVSQSSLHNLNIRVSSSSVTVTRNVTLQFSYEKVACVADSAPDKDNLGANIISDIDKAFAHVTHVSRY